MARRSWDRARASSSGTESASSRSVVLGHPGLGAGIDRDPVALPDPRLVRCNRTDRSTHDDWSGLKAVTDAQFGISLNTSLMYIAVEWWAERW
jgi:hypothetical protein